jgi:hypothetical protein
MDLEHQNKTHSPDSLPSLGERRRVLSQFLLMHRLSFRKAVESVVFLNGGVENFDLKSYCMIVNFRWRKTTDGNPSMAFHVVAADLRPMDEVKSKPHYKQTIDASEATRDAYEAGKRKLPSEKGFVGTLVAIYEMEGFFIAKGEEVWENGSFFHKSDIWKQELEMAVEMGVVFQPTGIGKDPWTKAGRYRLEKSKWHWVKLTAEEWKAIGRPPGRLGLFF